MTSEDMAPPAELASCVEAFWTRERAEEVAAHRVLPDGRIDILFTERARGCRLSVIGPMTRFLDVEAAPGDSHVGVRFQPGAAPSLLGCPAADLVDERLPLEDLWGSLGRSLLDRLTEAASLRERVEFLREAVRERRAASAPTDRRVAAAVTLMRSRPEIKIDDVCRSIGVSARQLRRLFVDAVGLSPKGLQRILRLQSVLAVARPLTGGQRPPFLNWAAVSVDAGYYDQAHFVNDFRAWAGLSPNRYLAAL